MTRACPWLRQREPKEEPRTAKTAVCATLAFQPATVCSSPRLIGTNTLPTANSEPSNKSTREGNLQVRLDSGQEVQFNIRDHPHIDYGYAVTSHSSQGATADRVLVHVDTEQAHDQLVNSRLAYVSVSRGRYDAQIYTNDAGKLGEELSRDVSKQSAMETAHESVSRDQGHAAGNSDHESVSQSHDQSEGYGMGH